MTHKSAKALLTFSPEKDGSYRIPQTQAWYSVTHGENPNDFSIRIQRVGDINSDHTMVAEIDFLIDTADYLLKPGAKFKLGPNSNCLVEVIGEI